MPTPLHTERVRIGVEAALVDGVLVRGDVAVEDGRISAVGLAGTGRGFAVPGFVDLHVHGFGGVDFATADAAGYRRAGEALLATGVTAFKPTFVTAPVDELVASLREVPTDPVGPARPRVPSRGTVHLARAARHAPRRRAARSRPAQLARLLEAGPVSHMTSRRNCQERGSCSPL